MAGIRLGEPPIANIPARNQQSPHDPIVRLAEAHEKAVALAVYGQLAKLRSAADIEPVHAALQKSQEHVLLALAPHVVNFGRGLVKALASPLMAAHDAAAGLTARHGIAKAARLAVSFDTVNPTTVETAAGYQLRLAGNLTQETLQAIQNAIVDGARQGLPIDVQAARIQDVIGLNDRQARAVANFRTALVTGDQGAALDNELRDRRFDRTIAGGDLSPEQVDAIAARYVHRQLAYRANMIARTESLRAANLGAEATVRQAVDRGELDGGQVVRNWLVSDDERLCKICASIPELTPDGVGLDEPFQSIRGEVWLPPEHPNCRCTIGYSGGQDE